MGFGRNDPAADLPLIASTDVSFVEGIALDTNNGRRRMPLTDVGNFRKDFTISSAQLLALNATPITIVAAPGANICLIPTGLLLFYDYNSAAYAGIAAGEDLIVRYTNGSGAGTVGVEATGFLDQTSDQWRYAYPISQGATQPLNSFTPVANAALVLHMATGEITTGNSPLYGRIWFRKVQMILP